MSIENRILNRLPGRWISFLVGILVLLGSSTLLHAITPHTIVVDPSGEGDFRTITEAVESLPVFTYERIVIFIKNGDYEEKICIYPDSITLRGESRNGVRIFGDLPRGHWREHLDAVGPGLINIYGDDVIIENLTVENTHPETSIHAFAIYGKGTRTVIQDANVWSNGGDTVSLWNLKDGMYYHRNCDFRGAVDSLCPRGWCYVRDSSFYSTNGDAILWHAGAYDEDQKFVLKNCEFDGNVPYELGRHHYDAQFVLVDCEFSDKLMDKPIYRRWYPENPERDRWETWGGRYYFSNSNHPNMPWTHDNLDQLDSELHSGKIDAKWAFGGRWDPERSDQPYIISVTTEDDSVVLEFSERMTVRDVPELCLGNGEVVLKYWKGAGSDHLVFKGTLSEGLQLSRNRIEVKNGELLATQATTRERHF